MINDIIAALLLTHPADIKKIKRYLAWVIYRRKMHEEFYPAYHWARSSCQYHWIGR